MPNATNVEFTGWRAYLWPIHRHELKKLIPLLLLFFLIMFTYNVLRSLKDTLVINPSGAEVIPFIKVWVMFPGSVLMTFLFTRLSSRWSREAVFFSMISIFLLYFAFFLFAIYPLRESLHPHQFADFLQETLPSGFAGFIAMIRYWTYTSFYVMAELWGNIVLFVLLWGFVNQVTLVHEAKRFYGLLGIGGNFSGFVAGAISVAVSQGEFNPLIPFGVTAWEQSLTILIGLVILSGCLALALFSWLNAKVIEPASGSQRESKLPREKMSMRESFAYLFRSNYLLAIAVIVIAYNLVINLVEVLWKHEIHQLYKDPSDFNVYLNEVMMVISIIATLTSILVTGNSVRKCGWTFTALLTPLILLVTSIGFFAFFFLQDHLGDFALLAFGTSPLAVVVFFGTLQNVFSRAAKYTIYDATKEMAWVPLSNESQLKGKAAIDGVCNRLGKSGGSFIHQALLLNYATFSLTAPYVAVFLLVAIVIWISAVQYLGKQFNLLTMKPIASIKEEELKTSVLISEEALLQEQRAV